MAWLDETRRVMDACKGSFGEPIIYTRTGLDPISLVGIPDEAFESVDPGTGVIIISDHPMVGIKIIDLPFTPRKDDLVTMRSRDFRVVESQTDGHAGLKLLLHKAAS